MNEIAKIEEPKIEIEYPKITFYNYEEVKTNAQNLANKYEGFVVTRNSFRNDKKVLRDIKRQSKQLDDLGKDLKKKLQAPILEALAQLKELKEPTDKIISEMDEAIKFFENEEKNKRHDQRIEYIKSVADEADVDWTSVVYDKRWDNKTANMGEFERNVEYQINNLIKDKERFEDDSRVIEQKANSLHLDHNHYIPMLKQKSLPEILSEMEDYHNQLQDMVQRQKHQDEADKAVKQATQKVVGNNVIDITTGEKIGEIKSYNLKVSGTLNQMKLLAKFMSDNNIRFERLEDKNEILS